jgi:hypothetical protein
MKTMFLLIIKLMLILVTRGRFLFWLMFLTFADLVLTHVGAVCISKDYEASPLGSFVVTHLGEANGLIFLGIFTCALVLFLTVQWENRLVKKSALGLFGIKVIIFLYHFIVLYVGSLI